MFRAIFATVTAQPNALGGASVKVFCWQMCGEIDDENRTLVLTFALGMQAFLDKPVVDETGLAGRYDFVLKWIPDELSANDPNAPPGIFTAVQEQLGLKLEPTKGPTDVLVIDHVERPTEN